MSTATGMAAESRRGCWRAGLVMYSPVLLAVLIMLPRLLAPQFGLLDDGATISSARAIDHNWAAPLSLCGNTGRFFPFYWVYYYCLFKIAGASPLAFFAAHCVLLGLTIAVLIYFARLAGATRVQSGVAGLVFVASGPVVENFYTLSKAEPIQVLFLLLSLILIEHSAWQTKRVRELAFVAGAAGTMLVADLTKETSLAMVPISGALLALALFRKCFRGQPTALRPAALSLLASGTAGVAFFLLRAHFAPVPISSGTYSQAYSFAHARETAWALAGWLIRDFPQLLPLGVFVGLALMRCTPLPGKLLAFSVVWMFFWMAIFLPWHSSLEYYLLPFAVGAALFSGLAIGECVAVFGQPGRKAIKTIAAICLAVAVWLAQFTVVNNIANARFQLTVDRANSELVDFLSQLPAGSQVFVNLPEGNEYVHEVGLHLRDLKRRPDLSVDAFRFQLASAAEPRRVYYVASPTIEGQIFPSLRIGVHEPTANLMNACLEDFLGGENAPVYRVEHSFSLLDVGLHRILCGISATGLYGEIPRLPVEGRTFSYGWQVRRVEHEVSHQASAGRYYAGGRWELDTPSGGVEKIQFGQDGDIPIVGDWKGDGSTQIGVFRPSDLTWRLAADMNGKADTVFTFEGMKAGDIPLAGDWDGNGTATPGYFRPEDGSWHLRNSNSTGPEDWPVLHCGATAAVPVVGDWDGHGRDCIGIYQPATGEVDLKTDLGPSPPRIVFNGPPRAVPVVGKWSGGTVDSFAFVVGTRWELRPVNGHAEVLNAPAGFEFGSAEGSPLGGKWKPTP